MQRLLVYCEEMGLLPAVGGQTFKHASAVWPSEILVAEGVDAEAARAELERHVRAVASTFRADDQGVTLVSGAMAPLSRDAAQEIAEQRFRTNYEAWELDGAPIIEQVWEGADAWAFLVSSGNMDIHGMVIDKFCGRCFLRPYAYFAEEFTP